MLTKMIFGHTLAVIVGFLFTAGRNWSGQPTPSGTALAALASLWIGGRMLVLTPLSGPAAIVPVAFPLAAAIGLGRALVAAHNCRNYFFIGVLVGIALAVLAVHLVQLRVVDLPDWLGIHVALDIVLFIIAVMGGRVIPIFTNNGVPVARAVRHAGVERAALGSALVLLAVDALQLHGAVPALVLVIAALAHLARLWLWQPWTTLRTPVVWVLHAAYLWIPVHFAIRAAAEPGWLAAPAATHALTVGVIGGLTIGTMTRTARGRCALTVTK